MLCWFCVPDGPTSFWTSFSTALNKFYTFSTALGGLLLFLPSSQVFQCIFFILWWIFWLPSLSCPEVKYFTLLCGAGHGWKGWKSNNPISCLPWSIPRALRAAGSPRIEFLTALPACTALVEARKGQTILTPQLSQGKLVDILRSDMI